MKRASIAGGIAVALIASAAFAGTRTASAPLSVSPTGASPFAGCNVGGSPTSTNFSSGEVEPHVATNPANTSNVIGAWQQDRWSDGGAKGNSSAFSTDGGQSWSVNSLTKHSICSGGAAVGGNYERATDPWVTVAPNGHAYLMSLSFNQTNTINAMLVSKSADGGATWSNPTTLIRDENPHVFNDKNTITADPNEADGSHVYAVWDRLVFPNERTRGKAWEHAAAFKGPIYFTRTTNGGTSWEPARNLFDPGRNQQTIGNLIVVLPDNATLDGELINVFNLIHNRSKGGTRGFNLAIMVSDDQGATWSSPRIVQKIRTVGVEDPDDGDDVRTGDIIPQATVDPATGALYAVWQDSRFSNGDHDGIAFSKSTDGGATWTPPVQINQAPGVAAFTPMVSVAGDGTIAVTYYDFRFNTSDPNTLPTDYWAVHSHDGGATWSETRITPSSFDMEKAPEANGLFVGDYEGLTAVGTTFVAFFSQANSTADPATVYASRF